MPACGRADAPPRAAAAASARAWRAPRTTPPARWRPPTRTARTGSGGPLARRGRAPPPLPGRGPGAPGPRRRRGPPRCAASRLHLQRGDLLAAALQLDHEDPVDLGREVEAHAAALLHVLVEVVAVHVDLVGYVGRDGESDGVALVHLDLLHAPDGLGVLHDDLDGDVLRRRALDGHAVGGAR